jgi:hypothetical protein
LAVVGGILEANFACGEVENSRKYFEEAIAKEYLYSEIKFDRCGAMVPVITVHDISPCHCF